jgi:hypothetical protein
MIQDHLKPAAMAENMDARLLEPSIIDVHKQGGVLPVMGAAPALAKDITSAEPAGKAKKAIAARPEALISWAQDKAMHRHEVKMPPQEGKCTHDPPPEALPWRGECKPEVLPQRGKHTNKPLLEALPPEGQHNLKAPPQKCEHEADTPLQSNLNKGEHKPCWPPRESSHEDVLSTWQGPGPWDPGGPAGERTTESRGPVKANNKYDIVGIDTCKLNKEAPAMQTSSQLSSTILSSQTHTLDPSTIIPPHHPKFLPSRSCFISF